MVKGIPYDSIPETGNGKPPLSVSGVLLNLAEQKQDMVPALIEVTRGSPNKYEIDKETGQLKLWSYRV